MERLEPIPSPPGHLVREFFHRAVPVIVFAIGTASMALLWNTRFSGTILFGEVEPIRADVTTTAGGTITEVLVDRFQTVTNGQLIATVETMDTDAARRALDVLRSELQVMRSRMALDEARNDQNIEGVRVRWLEARVDLATARVSLENARRDLQRADALFTDRIIAEAEHDAARSVFEALDAEVRERAGLLEGLQSMLDRLDSASQRDRSGSLQGLSQALAAQEREVEAARVEQVRASMDGVVKAINHRAGERVPAGAILSTVTSPHSEHIVGYVRQPLIIDPRPGMPVEIRTRGPKRQVVRSSIRSVGSDLELINSPLRLRGFDNAVERGLAFFVDLPPELDVHPGELVDLVVRPMRAQE